MPKMRHVSIDIRVTMMNRSNPAHSTADNANAPRTPSTAHATKAATEKEEPTT